MVGPRPCHAVLLCCLWPEQPADRGLAIVLLVPFRRADARKIRTEQHSEVRAEGLP